MTEHPNVERARRGFHAFAEGDAATIVELLDEEVVWRIPGRNQLAGEHAGRDAALGVLRRSAELTAGTHCAVLRWAVADDDRWVEVDAVPFDQHAFDEFWAD